MSMSLKGAMAASVADSLSLSDPAGTTVTIPAGMVARLWTAAADDRNALGLYLLGQPDGLALEVESAEDEAPVVTVGGVLRYLLDIDGETLVRLCTAPACPNESTGTRSTLTRVCTGHLNTAVPGLLPNAGDDIRPGDRESAAQESRTMRLAAWESELRDTEREIVGDFRVLEALRNES